MIIGDTCSRNFSSFGAYPAPTHRFFTIGALAEMAKNRAAVDKAPEILSCPTRAPQRKTA